MRQKPKLDHPWRFSRHHRLRTRRQKYSPSFVRYVSKLNEHPPEEFFIEEQECLVRDEIQRNRWQDRSLGKRSFED